MKKAFSWPGWFLVGALIFLIIGIRYILVEDSIGAIINFVIAAVFYFGYSKRRKR
ncbi:MAG: hypothetical protein ABIB47_06245 [Candidatus Woesearchaeota archaeon]